MTKGKTNDPLVVWVYHPWISHPKIGALHNAGHRIVAVSPEDGSLCWISPAPVDENPKPPDLILHPSAHQWNEELWDYLDVAIKAARARKRKARTP